MCKVHVCDHKITMNQVAISNRILSNELRKLFRYQHMISFIDFFRSHFHSASIFWIIHQRSFRTFGNDAKSLSSSFRSSDGPKEGEDRRRAIFSGQVPEHSFIHARFVSSTMALQVIGMCFSRQTNCRKCWRVKEPKTEQIASLLASISPTETDLDMLRSCLGYYKCGLSERPSLPARMSLRPQKYFEIFARPSIHADMSCSKKSGQVLIKLDAVAGS